METVEVINRKESSYSEKPNNSDTISRHAAIRWIKTECNPYGKPTLDYETSCRIMEHLDKMPSAQPEIIRCKDCIYYRQEIDMCDEPHSTAHNVVHEDDYCSKAERRTDAETEV